MTTNNSWNSQYPLNVAKYGTGDASLTAYSVLCGGTTSTAAVQSVSGVGTLGQILTSNGSSLPTWQANPTAPGAYNLIQTQSASSSASIVFIFYNTAYTNFFITMTNVVAASSSQVFNMDWSTDSGGTYLNSGYLSGINTNPYNSNTVTNNSSTTICPLTSTSGLSTSIPLSGIMYLYQINSSSLASYYGYNFNGLASVDEAGIFFGTNTNSGINAIRFSMGSGNLTSGTFSLYGVKT